MNAALLSLALFCAFPDAEPEVPAVAPPTGPAPTLMVLQIKGDQLLEGRIVTVAVPKTVTETVNIGGKEVQLTKTVLETVQKQEMVSTRLTGATAMTTDGVKIDLDALKKRLAKPTLVVVNRTGAPLDKGYLEVFKRGTLVVNLPASTAPVFPRPAPMPAPRPTPKVEIID